MRKNFLIQGNRRPGSLPLKVENGEQESLDHLLGVFETDSCSGWESNHWASFQPQDLLIELTGDLSTLGFQPSRPGLKCSGESHLASGIGSFRPFLERSLLF